MAKRLKAPVEEIAHPALGTPTPPRVYTSDTAKLEAASRESALPSDALISTLPAMIDRVRQLEADLAEIDEMRAVRAARLRELVEDLIPAAMGDVESFKLANGVTVKIQPVTSATLGRGKDESEPAHEQRVERAFEWLTEHGHDGIIKVAYEVKLPRGDAEADESVKAALSQIGVDFKREVGVHHATLSAFVKGQKENGDPVPLDLFRVAEHKRAVIKAPKEK